MNPTSPSLASSHSVPTGEGSRDPTVALACALIQRPSITPEDAGCQQLLQERLQTLGFTAQDLSFGKVRNLWLRWGHIKPLIVLAGHTDVVPPGPASGWESPPFHPTLRAGKLWGRGAADMKSSLAAFVVALERHLGRHPACQASFALLLTSDEEGEARDGTRRVVEWLRQTGQSPDYCLVGEPTSVKLIGDTLKIGRRGSLSGQLTVHGHQGHVAYPALALNPIHALAPALAELVAVQWDEGDDQFPPTGLQISNLQAGTGATNVIPGELTLWFNFRFSPLSTPEQLRMHTEQLLRRHGIEFTLDWELGALPFRARQGTLVEAALNAVRKVTGREPELSTSGGTSDARFLIELCPELIELGPCNATIHQQNECVDLADLAQLTTIYQTLLESISTTTASPAANAN